MSRRCTTPDCTGSASHSVKIGNESFPVCLSCSDFMKEHAECAIDGAILHEQPDYKMRALEPVRNGIDERFTGRGKNIDPRDF